MLAWAALGLSSAWEGVPPPARVLDVALIAFNLVTAVGLWLLRGWAVILLFAGAVLLQFVPYVLLRGTFLSDPQIAVDVNTLLIVEFATLALFAVLIARRR